MTYINRDLEEKIKSASKEYACILITGARQVGKSTVLKRLMDDNREEVLLDDIEERKLASKWYAPQKLDTFGGAYFYGKERAKI